MPTTVKPLTIEAPALVLPPANSVVAAKSQERVQDARDATEAGQRNVNLIWENTQMRIALSVIWSALVVSAIMAVIGTADLKLAANVFLYGVANLVTGFYFGRTNHQKTGGVQSGDAGR